MFSVVDYFITLHIWDTVMWLLIKIDDILCSWLVDLLKSVWSRINMMKGYGHSCISRNIPTQENRTKVKIVYYGIYSCQINRKQAFFF